MTQPTKKFTLFTVMILIVSSLAACGYNNNNPDLQNQGYQNRMNDNMGVRNMDGYPQTYNNGMNRGTYPYDGRFNNMNNNMMNNNMANNNNMQLNQRVADRMENTAEKVNGVSESTVIVRGNDAVVGIDLKENQNRNNVERKVHRALRQTEPGYNIHVTSEQKLHNRIKNMDTQMTDENQPVQDLTEDFTSLVRDIGRTVTAPFR